MAGRLPATTACRIWFAILNRNAASSLARSQGGGSADPRSSLCPSTTALRSPGIQLRAHHGKSSRRRREIGVTLSRFPSVIERQRPIPYPPWNYPTEWSINGRIGSILPGDRAVCSRNLPLLDYISRRWPNGRLL